ncbi:hypothetical protein [Streptomyces sp. NPDC054866]
MPKSSETCQDVPDRIIGSELLSAPATKGRAPSPGRVAADPAGGPPWHAAYRKGGNGPLWSRRLARAPSPPLTSR